MPVIICTSRLDKRSKPQMNTDESEFEMNCNSEQINTDKKQIRRRRIATSYLCSSLPAIRWCALAFLICVHLWSAFAFAAAAPQKVVDQIISLVNEDIITRSDLLWSLAMDPQAPNPAEGVSSDLLRQKLDVMIDQRLIAQEARRVPTAEITAEDINQRRAALIRDFKSETIFRQRVEAVGLTSTRVDELIRERILIERFVDFRFRSFVFVTEPEIQRYYDETLAPQIRARGQVAPSLDDKIKDDTGKEVTVRELITEIIRRDKINQEIDRFLNAARQRADITLLTEP